MHQILRTIFTICFALLVTVPVAAEPATDKGDIVAEINETIIKRSDLNEEFDRQLKGQKGTFNEEQTHALRAKLLDRMIQRELLFQEAKKGKHLPAEKEIDDAIATFITRVGSEEKFIGALTENKLSKEIFREQLAKDLAVSKFVDTKVFAGVTVSDEDVAQFYKSNPQAMQRPTEVRARHILVKVEEGADAKADAAAKEKITELLGKAKKEGADFSELAKGSSECPSAPRGGDLGFFTENQMVKPFSEVAFKLKPGETSDIVKTQFGYHIIKVEERKEAGMPELAEIKDQLKQALLREKQGKAVEQVIADLKTKGKVISYLK